MNIKDVEALAGLARIELSPDEKKSLLSDMEGILGYIKQIESVKIENAQENQPVYNVWREDEAEKCEFDKKLIIGQFPDAQDDFLKVKKIL